MWVCMGVVMVRMMRGDKSGVAALGRAYGRLRDGRVIAVLRR